MPGPVRRAKAFIPRHDWWAGRVDLDCLAGEVHVAEGCTLGCMAGEDFMAADLAAWGMVEVAALEGTAGIRRMRDS